MIINKLTKYPKLYTHIKDYLPLDIKKYLDNSKILDREIDRLTYARDASIYRIIPEFAIRPADENDIKQIFKYAVDCQKSITFRASGTSLSGQTVTDGIIAEIAYDWQRIEVKNNGNSILLEPGVIGEHANQALVKYQKRIGPDPASIKAARIGGIIANNASGMTTGRPCNSYNTLKNIRFILANGNIYDTSQKNAYSNFIEFESNLSKGLISIRNKILNNDLYKSKILEKYRLKNTIGYSLNAFLDFEEPLDIFAHLLIGSEGTLAFVSNIELETVSDPPYKSAGLILFDNIRSACNAIEAIKLTGVQGLELMDYASLMTAKYVDNAPYDHKSLLKGSAALLCEYQEFDESKFEELEISLKHIIESFGGELIGDFAKDEIERLKLWKIRKSLFTTIGSLRKPGTSVITEDICFDLNDLGNAITELHHIFAKWKYDDAVIFGHAKDGNLHFNLSIDLESENGIKDYHKMMEEVIKMTVGKYNGSLKAEHGTGRNMAPYVEYEWGSGLYQIMWEIKKLADPHYVLNAGVILNHNKDIHIENLKPMPKINKKIDLCVECGFCEPVCPSRRFTLTPRNRIALSRELELLDKDKPILRDYNFYTELSCAVDGMCETACPINIDTGEFVKDLRKENIGKIGFIISNWIVDHFKLVNHSLVFAVKIMSLKTKLFGKKIIRSTFNFINNISMHKIPTWNTRISGSIKSPRKTEYGSGEKYIYYPSCISRTFSADIKKNSIISIMGEIAEECDVKLIIPDNIEDTCCSTPFSSKGFEKAGRKMFEKTIELLYKISNYGEMPIVVDTSPCTYKFLYPTDNISQKVKDMWSKLTFVDIIPFLEIITNKLKYEPLDRKIILHPTCSTHKMEHVQTMKTLAQRCARKVVVPNNSSCCGFAGDRGIIVPDLTINAVELNKTSMSKEERKLNGYSSSRMCEIGVSDDEQVYESIALLVHEYIMSNKILHISHINN